jgi:hypothetical protein
MNVAAHQGSLFRHHQCIEARELIPVSTQYRHAPARDGSAADGSDGLAEEPGIPQSHDGQAGTGFPNLPPDLFFRRTTGHEADLVRALVVQQETDSQAIP